MSSLPVQARPRRPHLVWGSLTIALTLVAGGLMLIEPRAELLGGAAASLPPAAALDTTAAQSISDVLAAQVPFEQGKWTSIVINHSGSAMGSADTITKQHESAGLKGLGYHFVISNGQGAVDGLITAGPRWLTQQAGAHTKGSQGDAFNRHAIGICLVGDGDSRNFTDEQISELVRLTAALQAKFNIPASQVYLHRDLASTTSPGRLFPEAQFRARLAAAR